MLSCLLKTSTAAKSAMVQEFTSRSVFETEQLGEQLGRLLQAGDVVCLQGDLGAGKTAFVRGLARGWGAIELATSPTFALINQYHRSNDSVILFHIDCYRLETINDAWSAGIEDVFDISSVVVLEWPERIEALLPVDCLWITFTNWAETTRHLEFGTSGGRSRMLLRALL